MKVTKVTKVSYKALENENRKREGVTKAPSFFLSFYPYRKKRKYESNEKFHPEKHILELAIRRGIVGLGDVRGMYRCGPERARFILARLVRRGYLKPAVCGGFVPTGRTYIEVGE